jgi:protocatechuate 3,4-dioxygenase beta subunit
VTDVRPARLSRRAAVRAWLAGPASLALLAASGGLSPRRTVAALAEQVGGPAPAQIPPATGAGAGAGTPSATTPSAPPAAAAAPAPTCVLTREQTEGPYYIDVDLLRSDITEGKEGLPLRLELTVLGAASCQPLPNATVEIWHCDAAGDYSGFSGSLPDNLGEPPGSDSGSPPPRPGPGGGPPPGGGPSMRNTPTNELVFLRGGQVSDASGRVAFQTIYPGWYRGRTVHIHLKVHVGGNEVHTSQLFFDDAVSDLVFSRPPYAEHAGRDTTNATDSIFREGGGQGLVALTQTADGYTGAATLGVQV